MKSITIHSLDALLARELQKQSRAWGRSLNQTIKQLLRHSLGITEPKKSYPKNDFREFFGAWTTRDAKEFEKNVNVFEKVDPEDWQ